MKPNFEEVQTRILQFNLKETHAHGSFRRFLPICYFSGHTTQIECTQNVHMMSWDGLGAL